MSENVRPRRGDLVMVELALSHTTATWERVEELAYRLMVVTNLTRDGKIAKVRDGRHGEGSGYAVPFAGMLHRTGQYWLLPAAVWDVTTAQRLAREHVYPQSSTPRDFPTLEDARAALKLARR